MFLTNDKSKILKYKSEVIEASPELIKAVAHYAGVSIEHIEELAKKYFKDEQPVINIQDLINNKAKEIKNL